MIHPQELRIGNWVYPNEEIKIPFQIILIKGDYARCSTGRYFWQDDVDISYYKLHPIPLTPEILEKAGFGRCYESRFMVRYDMYDEDKGRNNGIEVSFSLDENSINEWSRGMNVWYRGVMLRKIESLHQLQNLIYALTGEELNIEL